jgi:hypothetical protein
LEIIKPILRVKIILEALVKLEVAVCYAQAFLFSKPKRVQLYSMPLVLHFLLSFALEA